MAPLSAQEILGFVNDLFRASWVKVCYFDNQGDLQEVRGDGALIEARPELTVSLNPLGDVLERVEVPFERVVFSTIFERRCEYCGDPECGDAENIPCGSWIIHNGRPYRLP